jgi:hypothetical protein
MRPKARAYYITDLAFGKLVGLAQRHRYVRFGTERAKGLSEFLNDLSHFDMEDTRPQIVKERHEQEIRLNRSPTWLYVYNRRARLLSLTDEALQKYVEVALQVGIIKKDPYPIGGPDRRTPYPTVSLVIEGIGLGWITPVTIPIGTL